MNNPDEARLYADGLRQIADWIEAHPQADLPAKSITVSATDTKGNAAYLMRALLPCEKTYGGSFFRLTKRFGVLSYEFLFYREAVCTARVVGKKLVPEQLIPAKPEELIPAHEVDEIEWDCHSILAASELGGTPDDKLPF